MFNQNGPLIHGSNNFPLRILGFFMVLFTLYGCPQERDPQDMALADLEYQWSQILALAQSVPCEDPAQWAFTPYGNQACGGPQGYLAYPLTIDVDRFLNLVEQYRQAENQYNIDFNIVSSCALPVEPTGVDCVDQSAVLVYG